MMRNLFASLKKGEIEGYTQLSIVDSTKFAEDLRSDPKFHWDDSKTLRENLRRYFTVIPFSTSLGDPDPEYLEWFVVLSQKEGLIIIVHEEQK